MILEAAVAILAVFIISKTRQYLSDLKVLKLSSADSVYLDSHPFHV